MTDLTLIHKPFQSMYKTSQASKTIILPLTVGQSACLVDKKHNWLLKGGYTIQYIFEIFKINGVNKSQMFTT